METIREILDALRANRLRTFLTGFAIVWGIFMLILLLAAGNGFKHGMESNFFYMAKNTISLYPGNTSKPYNGLQKGRSIRFSEEDIDFLEKEIGKMVKVNEFTPIFNSWGASVVYEEENVTVTLSGVRPGYEIMRNLSITEGRFLNKSDEIHKNKVMLISKKSAEYLFANEDPVGKYVKFKDILFEVVGIYTEKRESWRASVYIPFATAQVLFNPEGYITDVSFSVDNITTKEQSEEFSKELRALVAKRMNFDPDDTKAIWIRNSVENAAQISNIYNAINLFIWIIGIGTLISGIVGVGNIMIVSVKERTKEFGIRKALGATPASIVGNVILEALIITITFGYIGLSLGIILTETISRYMAANPKENTFVTTFTDPTVDLPVAVSALVILVVVGAAAGFIPAHKAVKIKTIDAIMDK